MFVMNMKHKGTRIAIEGARESGKTSLLIDLVKCFREFDLEVQGILEAGIFEGNKKVAIEVMDLAAGESRVLAQLSTEAKTELQCGDWSFFPEIFDWANERLAKIDTTDAFILDEVGPIELEQGGGLQMGLQVMSTRDYHMGIMSIRPKCLEAAKDLFPDLTVYSMTEWDTKPLLNELFRIAFTYNK